MLLAASRSAVLIGAIVVAATASTSGIGGVSALDAARAIHEDALASPEDPTKRDSLAKALPYISDLDAYVVEGDMLVKRAALVDYLKRRHDDRKKIAVAKGETPGATPHPITLALLLSPELKVNYVLGHPDIWRVEKRGKLSYAIDRASFGGDTPEYARVAENFRRAAEGWDGHDGWEQLCPTCGIDFQHVAEADAAPSFDHVLLIVKGFDSQGKFTAAAPFPSTPPFERYLYVDPSYFQTEYDPIGVFRHELGHVLGYRHEQLDELSGCYQIEDNEWDSLSPYDPDSVMHYFCGGHGTHSLGFSPTDRTSHPKLYAP